MEACSESSCRTLPIQWLSVAQHIHWAIERQGAHIDWKAIRTILTSIIAIRTINRRLFWAQAEVLAAIVESLCLGIGATLFESVFPSPERNGDNS
jgi:hypothetical protein